MAIMDKEMLIGAGGCSMIDLGWAGQKKKVKQIAVTRQVTKHLEKCST